MKEKNENKERHDAILRIMNNIHQLSRTCVDDIQSEYRGNIKEMGKALITHNAELLRMLTAASRFQTAVDDIGVDELAVQEACLLLQEKEEMVEKVAEKQQEEDMIECWGCSERFPASDLESVGELRFFCPTCI